MSADALEIIEAASPNFDARPRDPDMVVLHYTGMADGASALGKLCDPDPRLGAYRHALPPAWREGPDDNELGRASAHYVVEEDGRVFRLVAETDRAWHAGVAHWAGESDVNGVSIGVEIVNGGHDFGLPAYKDAQIDAVIALCLDILERWNIPPWRVVGHSDVAPERKVDPGEHFPWMRLERAGAALGRGILLGDGPWAGDPLIFPGAAGPEVKRLQWRLAALGYGLAETGGYDARTEAVVTAFQRRWADVAPNTFRWGVWNARDEMWLKSAFDNARAAAKRAAEAGRPYALDPPVDPG